MHNSEEKAKKKKIIWINYQLIHEESKKIYLNYETENCLIKELLAI